MIIHSLRLLLVDRQEESFLQIKALLSEIQLFTSELDWQTSSVGAISVIAATPYDAYLLDAQLAISNHSQLLTKVFTPQTTTPVIWLVNSLEQGIAALKSGAADYLIRHQLSPPLLEHCLRLTVAGARSKAQLSADETCSSRDIHSLNKYPPVNFPQLILTESIDPVFITDFQGNFQFVCPHPEDIFGYSCLEIQQLGNINKILGQDLFKFSQLQSKKVIKNIQHKIVDKFDKIHILSITVKLLGDQPGLSGKTNILYICHDMNAPNSEQNSIISVHLSEQSFSRDFTQGIKELRLLESALQESEERFQITFEQVGVGLCHLSPTGEWLQLNDKFCKIVGYEREQLLQKTWLEITDPQDIERETIYLERLLSGKIDQACLDKRYIRQDGTVVWAQITTTVLRNLQGEPKYFIKVVEDITERLKIKLKIETLANRLLTVIQTVEEGITLSNYAGFFIIFNAKMQEITGYTGEEANKCDDFLALIYNEKEEEYKARKNLYQVLQNGQIQNIETTIKSKDGSQKTLLVSTKLLDMGEEPCFLSAYRDITQRQAERKELAKQKANLAEAQKISHLGNWELDLIEEKLSWSEETFRIFGFDPQQSEPAYPQVLELIHPDDIACWQRVQQQAIQEKISYEIELRIFRSDGFLRHLITKGHPIVNSEGQVIKLFGTFFDITERQRMESELRQSKLLIEAIADASPQILYVYDLSTGKNIYVNHQIYQLLGYKPEAIQEAGFQFFLDTIHPEDRKYVNESAKIFQNLKPGEVYEVEYRQRHIEGLWRWFRSRSVVFTRNQDGQPEQIISTAIDITEQKRVQMQLKESETRLHTIFSSISDGILIVDRNCIIRFANPAATKIFGRPLKELLNQDLEWPMVVGNTTELGIVLPDGQVSFAEMTVAQTEWDGDSVYAVCVRDIEQRRQAEDALRESEARFRQLTENIEALFWLIDSNTQEILYVSPAYEKIWGRSCESLYSDPKSWIEAIVPEDRVRVFGHVAKEEVRELTSMEYRIVRPDGEIRWIEARTFPIINDQGGILRIAGIAEDISDRKLQEAQLQEYRDRLVELVQKRTSQLATEVSQRQQAQSEIYFQARLLDVVNHAIIATDLSGTITYWNRYAETLYGWSSQEAVGQNILDITPTNQTREQGEEIFHQLQQGKIWAGEFTVKHRDGSCFPVMVNDAPFQNEAGELIGVVGISYDISKQKLAEAALKKANASLGITVEERTKDLAGAIQQLQEEIMQRQEAEIALRDSEQRFRALFEQGAVGMLLSRPTGEWIRLNQTLCQFFGYTESELLHMTWEDLTYPEDLNKFLHQFQRLVKGEIDTFSIEKRYRCKGGQIKWGNLTFSYVFSPQGEALYGFGVIEDICERKQAEAQLCDRLRLETALAEVSRELANQQVTNLDRVIQLLGIAVQANSAYLIVFESESTDLKEIYHWCDRQNQDKIDKFFKINRFLLTWWTEQLHKNNNLVISHVQNLPPEAELEKNIFQSLNICSMISVPIHSQSKQLWAEIGFMTVGDNVRNWSDQDAQLLRIVGEMLSSYWTSQRDREKLRDSEALYSGIFQHSAESIFLLNIDANGRFIYETINPSYEKIFNLTQKQVLGKSLAEILPINIADKFRVNFQKALNISKAITYEETLDLPDQKKILRTILLPIIDSSGNLVKLQGSSRDITAEKQFQKDLEQAKIAAELANRAKSEFLANMSHELRTPLNAILGFTQLMHRDLTLSKFQQEQLAIVHRSGEHLLSLINDILDLSKIELGRIFLQLNSFDVYQMLASLKEMLQVKADAKNLEFRMECDSGVPQYIETDEKKLRSTLINLIGNAIKFTEQGSIVLRVSLADYGLLESVDDQTVTGATQRLKLNFEIEDTGPGIAVEEINTLFQPFVQSKTGQKSAEGTGLGLAISQRFVRLMGGEITVTSRVDTGSMFKFDILCTKGVETKGPTQVLSRRAIALQPNQATYRILVVEDQWTNLKLLVNLLELVGFEVREARDGVKAVEIWQRWQPDLIFMDLRMPVMDGYQAIKQIRIQEQQHRQQQAINQSTSTAESSTELPTSQPNPGDHTVIITLTASAFESNRSVVLDIGCDDFIAKPFTENVLLEKISHHLGVQYIYQTNSDQSSWKNSLPVTPNNTSDRLTSDSLSVMPIDWIIQLHQTALTAREKRIYQLLEQIPQEERWLAISLTNLVKHLLFDQIVDLTQAYTR